ncbi:hypothetical protein ACG74X_13370 [Marivita sp. S0852]|uniref:hypothetical protein n=1 Tax=Marivita sp. S0852 TaxID=3373893 RepID=UPI0039822E0D
MILSWLLPFGGFLLTLVGFVLGRTVSESEKILAEKRRVYEHFITQCPVPNEAYDLADDETIKTRSERLHKAQGALLLYAAPSVAVAVSIYLKKFSEADMILGSESPPLHDKYKELAQAHNDIILEMRRDALAWSAFGYRGKTRLPTLSSN